MSLVFAKEVICGSCGYSFEEGDYVSTHSFGEMDLDTRPAPDYRFTMNEILVTSCPVCHFCYQDITQFSPDFKRVMESSEYLSYVNHASLPSKAKEFLCKSLLLGHENKFVEAAWASLHAAWNCDDRYCIPESITCRNKAIGLFLFCNYNKEQVFKDETEMTVFLIDLYRRSHNFKLALKLCNDVLALPILKPQTRNIATFQLHLINKQDTQCYNIQDAINFCN
ncbi:hypothetical protein [Plebeiibacterium marinum]|uniref:DUF2225 domain-containing protein n=1 Tax=Plebeiibacterium marinum TaxID=2992111 RepID=A0AAE3MEL7_9BACT|nr:hypothetical protein [Plebeiobacterium marinum]MCW3806187.1 hypothetical protein [Plebeiobacterium marinum]